MQKGHVHILGIAGHAMAGVALAASKLGYTVTGTDEGAYPPMSTWLTKQGINYWTTPDLAHLEGVTMLVLGGGVKPDHPELVEAQKLKLPIKSYPELVSELLGDARRIVVTGTHGKTTTTSLISWILESAGKKPDYLIGIKPHNFDSSVRLSGSQIAVLEGDEYRSSQLDTSSKFSRYKPNVAIITAIEHDHPDLFPDLESVVERFEGLVSDLPEDGRLYYCQASEVVRDVAVTSKALHESYGEGGDWEPRNVQFDADGIHFDLAHHDEVLGRLDVPLYGEHNVLNATAAAAVALGEGLSFEELAKGCKSFKGASRRFERVSKKGAKVVVIDDYAHHPTEAETTIDAVTKHFDGRVIAVFRPHTYSRTLGLLEEYQRAFDGADVAYIAEIEGAREAGLETQVSGADIAKATHVHYQPDRAKLVAAVVNEAKPGDVVLCMSVNGYEKLAEELAEKLA
jgi:UDP-N-acetylmuramate: L-alanyl-gamma-D-glutamyl-meso-diaminopimelate ligase